MPILVTFKHGSTLPDNPPYLVFIEDGLPRDQYLEARGDFEEPGYLISGEIQVPELSSSAVSLRTRYAVS